MTLPISQVESDETPRSLIALHFPSMGGELPIRGGWGYTKEDAVIIDKNDPVVDPQMPFFGIGIEYIFAEKRIYEELIIFRPDGEKFAGIRWHLMRQELHRDKDRSFDKLIFEITAFPEKAWEDLKAEWEGPNGHGSLNFDLEAHEKKREECMITIEREFWFDITSFYNC